MFLAYYAIFFFRCDGMQVLESLLLYGGIIFFGWGLLFCFFRMKNEMSSFTWQSYFKHCGIYQGRSYWTRLRKFLHSLNE